jgi:SAM-dependent methyltransferase
MTTAGGLTYERHLVVPDAVYEAQAQSLLDRATEPPHLRFDEVDDDFWVWLHTNGARRAGLSGLVPGFAEEGVQQRVTGVSGEAAVRDGFVVYRLVREIHRAHGGAMASAQILDFGVGWGRVLRFFLRDTPGERLVGVDAHDSLVQLCRALNPWCRFEVVDDRPPLPFADAEFDVVFAYSLFSHFSEPAHRAWIDELARVLRAGGTLVVTTWGRDLIERCDVLRTRADVPPYEAHLATLFDPASHWLADYDAGRYCFQAHEVYGDRADDFGEAAVPEAWVRRNWPGSLEITHFFDDRAHCQQAVIAARKP